MAVYKVIQDIEAEDKLIGPLTLKGFIYAITAGFLIFINVRIAIANSGGNYRFIAILILIWPALLFGVLASPLGREQPTEVWLLSHVMFFLKPRERLWHQQGPLNNVTITAPKKEELPIKNLSSTQIHSRLETLALTMDSRGWAIKNAYSAAASNQPAPAPLKYLDDSQNSSDRLVKRTSLANSSASDIHPSEDVLDLENSPRAQQVENMLQQKSTQLMEERLAKLDSVRRENNISKPLISDAEQKPGSKIHGRHDSLQPQPKKHQSAEEAAQSARNMSLSQGTGTLSIQSLSKLANRPSGPRVTKIAPGEVEITLH